MRLLLDTHVFLWFITGDERLPEAFSKAICDPANDVFLSVVSIWESMVKHSLGKLSLPADPAVYLPTLRKRHGIATLPLDEASVLQIAALPNLHRDPFDRMLICQAISHDMSLVSQDKALAQYKVRLLPE